MDKRYGFAVDWWDFGVAMYQLVCRQSPFTGDNEDGIYDAILEKEPSYGIDIPQVTTSFLRQLLTHNAKNRLGSSPTNTAEVMDHEYFAGIDWEGLYHKKVPAPFIPNVNGASDTSNFEPEHTSMAPVLVPEQSGMINLQCLEDAWEY